ncbi:hypothetical protein [Stutzerimonas nitrititolerans]|uniref:hypothetical protein n=1 Tax=Stutzerimonas nitrititolerans TaxID=2482751 RepID=UPI0028A0D8AF|nr:hypothetical protein [Stutzerimonas nitrititolerans]
MSANTEPMVMGVDPLNVLRDEVKPLPRHVLARVKKGKTGRTQILDGSMLEQHADLVPYALTHVTMIFDNEDDIIRCARMLQWSDERMRSKENPRIMWEWKRSFREGMAVEFSVAWYSKEFFEQNRVAFKDKNHQNYFHKFGLSVADIKTQDEVIDQNNS